MRVGRAVCCLLSVFWVALHLGLIVWTAYQLLNNNLVFNCAKPSWVTVEAFLWKDSCLFTQRIQADNQETDSCWWIWDLLTYQQLRYTIQWRQQLPREYSCSPGLRLRRSSTKDCENRQPTEKDGVLSGMQQSTALECVFYGWVFFPMIFF